MEARATLKAYLELCRVSNLPTVWSNVLSACLLAGATLFDAGATVLVALSLSLFYLGGMALNDLCDSDYDRVHRPSRPIPSGRIAASQARLFTLALFAGGFLALALVPGRNAFPAALLLLAVVVAYDLHHKRNPYSVLLMASCRFLVFVVAALALSGRLPAPVILAGTLQFGYIVLLSLVARHENSHPVTTAQVLSPGGGGLGRGEFAFPVIPVMLAGISLVDGVMLAFLVQPLWLLAGVGGFLLTLAGQRCVRGD